MKTMKRCSCCKVEKPLTAFCKNRSRPDGLNCDCRNCAAKYRKRWRENNKEKDDARGRKWHKEHKPSSATKLNKVNCHLKRTFGITLKDFDQMFEQQNGVCAICGKPETATTGYGSVRRLSVDHDHKTGKVRALLCTLCNHGLGIYENGKEQFEKYLRNFK